MLIDAMSILVAAVISWNSNEKGAAEVNETRQQDCDSGGKLELEEGENILQFGTTYQKH